MQRSSSVLQDLRCSESWTGLIRTAYGAFTNMAQASESMCGMAKERMRGCVKTTMLLVVSTGLLLKVLPGKAADHSLHRVEYLHFRC